MSNTGIKKTLQENLSTLSSMFLFWEQCLFGLQVDQLPSVSCQLCAIETNARNKMCT